MSLAVRGGGRRLYGRPTEAVFPSVQAAVIGPRRSDLMQQRRGSPGLVQLLLLLLPIQLQLVLLV